jgi:hypothetical protein
LHTESIKYIGISNLAEYVGFSIYPFPEKGYAIVVNVTDSFKVLDNITTYTLYE